MGKYEPLKTFLLSSQDDEVALSFDEIERLIGAALPPSQKHPAWWSYRAADFRASNRGLRLDHLWVSPGLREAAFRNGLPSAHIHDDVREWAKPSDHAPVSVDLAL